MKPAHRQNMLLLMALLCLGTAGFIFQHYSKSSSTVTRFQVNELRAAALVKFSDTAKIDQPVITFTWPTLEQYVTGATANPGSPCVYSVGISPDQIFDDTGHRENASLQSAPVEYAGFLVLLAKYLDKSLGEEIGLELKVFRVAQVSGGHWWQHGGADFMIMDAGKFLTFKSEYPGLVPLACSMGTNVVVLFATQASGLQNVRQLKGKTVLFADPDCSATVLAKARLVDVDLDRFNVVFRCLEGSANPADSPATSYVKMQRCFQNVLDGKASASLVSEKFFATRHAAGLTQLDAFPNAPKILIARPGLDAKLLQATREALARLPGKTIKDFPSQAIQQFAPIPPGLFDELRRAQEKARQFDRQTG